MYLYPRSKLEKKIGECESPNLFDLTRNDSCIFSLFFLGRSTSLSPFLIFCITCVDKGVYLLKQNGGNTTEALPFGYSNHAIFSDEPIKSLFAAGRFPIFMAPRWGVIIYLYRGYNQSIRDVLFFSFGTQI